MPGCYEESQWKFVEIGVQLCSGEEGDRTDKAVRGDGGELDVGEASCEAERDEKEVDVVGHAEGDDVDELTVHLDLWMTKNVCTALIP